jgi:signal transduction histidine kinase
MTTVIVRHSGMSIINLSFICYCRNVAIAETTFKPVIQREATLEPGLLKAFRVFNLVPMIGIIIFFVLIFFPNSLVEYYAVLFPGLTSVTFVGTIISIEVCKTLYLFWPNLPKRLGNTYLYIGIILSLLTPLVRLFFGLAVNPEWVYTQLPHSALLFYFLIPLIFIAWQYGFRGVLYYSGFLALIEFPLYFRLLDFQPNLWLLFQGSIIRIASYLVIGYFITYLVSAQRKQRDELAKANAQLLNYSHALEQLAESRERNRLARELHDTLAHYMSGTILQLNGAKTLWASDDAKAKTMVSEAIQTLTQGLDETRNAIKMLRSSPIQNLGLAESLRDLATQYAEKLGFELKLELESIRYLPETVGQNLYHIAQEILRNVERHAEAKRLSVTLKKQGHQLLLVIEDDGKGFRLEDVDKTKHFGLLGLEERTALLHGDVSVHSRPNQGTRVEVRIPLEQA